MKSMFRSARELQVELLRILHAQPPAFLFQQFYQLLQLFQLWQATNNQFVQQLVIILPLNSIKLFKSYLCIVCKIDILYLSD